MDASEADMAVTPTPKPGSKRPLPNTPTTYNINKEHEIYHIASPSLVPDPKTTKTDHTHQPPHASNHIPQPTTSSHAAAPATLADIAHLLQTQLATQLAPITKEINEVKTSMQSTMQGVKDELKQQIDELDERITQIESHAPPTNPPKSSTDEINERIGQIEAEIYKLKQPNHSTTLSSTSTPAVFGGLSSTGDLDGAKGWVSNMLWDGWLKGPSKMYCKGNFKGIIWAEFANSGDRDAAIQRVKDSGAVLGQDRVWANVEKPVEDRVPLSILIRAKYLLIKWGIPKEQLWVDAATNTLSYDNKAAISTKVIDLKLMIEFQDDWAEYIKGGDWDTLVKEASSGLDRKREQHSKGKGNKGKGKEKGKEE